jgi:hypothetical protein
MKTAKKVRTLDQEKCPADGRTQKGGMEEELWVDRSRWRDLAAGWLI